MFFGKSEGTKPVYLLGGSTAGDNNIKVDRGGNGCGAAHWLNLCLDVAV
jgi:hypothetical protein